MIGVLHRSVWLPAAVTGVILMVALAAMVGIAWRSERRMRPIHEHMDHLRDLQRTGILAQELLMDGLRRDGFVESARLSVLRQDVEIVIAFRGFLDPETSERLSSVRALLAGEPSTVGRDALVEALEGIGAILSAEFAAHDALLQTVARDTRGELVISTGLTLALPLLAVLLLYLLRRRFLLPLNSLRDLMAVLGRPDYRTVTTSGLDPLLRPVFDNYNHMVARLHDLEREHRQRQQSLEEAVRAATGTLLEQQRVLSSAERLAAVGEVAAGVAHELRNPLAGIQMALSGIRRELTDPEQGTRLDLAIGEVKRVSRSLNGLLDLARQPPEPAVQVRLADLATELIALLRYQVPDTICLRHSIAPDLTCRLPEGGFRQALLNLMLNSTEAIGAGAGEIELRSSHGEGQLSVSVIDDGPGFPEELLENGVRPFTTWREGGTGLGLAMVRRFVKNMGGELVLERRQPRGASVTMLLPCKEPCA
jgi:signal transduction histidine kinase